MREIFTSGTVGGALGNQCFYPEIFSQPRRSAELFARSHCRELVRHLSGCDISLLGEVLFLV